MCGPQYLYSIYTSHIYKEFLDIVFVMCFYNTIQMVLNIYIVFIHPI